MICLCATPAALLCPEHEQDGPGLRGDAYETLAMMYADVVVKLTHPDRDPLNAAAIDEIRKACAAIMGGNLAFVDDDFARCLYTMKDRAEKAEKRVEELEYVQREFHNISDIARIRDLEAALKVLRPHVENITLRAVIDEALPKEKPMP